MTDTLAPVFPVGPHLLSVSRHVDRAVWLSMSLMNDLGLLATLSSGFLTFLKNGIAVAAS